MRMLWRSTGVRSLRSRGRWTTTPVERGPAARIEQDHVDRVVVRAGDAPQVGGRAVRRHRARSGGEHRGGDALLRVPAAADESGDAGVQRLEQAGVDARYHDALEMPAPSAAAS